MCKSVLYLKLVWKNTDLHKTFMMFCNISLIQEMFLICWLLFGLVSSQQLRAKSICFRTSTVAIKRRSRVPGVMITQFVEEVPEGMSTPDFTRKPIALTIQEGRVSCYCINWRAQTWFLGCKKTLFLAEYINIWWLSGIELNRAFNVHSAIHISMLSGKLAFFKSMVSGVPKPNITWARNKGPLDDPVKYISRYDETMEEYFLEVSRSSKLKARTTISTL